ncbi:uncharacterized protein LOC135950641 [Calliphora vicina]|uniref:uncharacterized protein LOC135950641 n=1 Tax=Calliphora vicina TaxID=7373 RepID=UPI00325A6D08
MDLSTMFAVMMEKMEGMQMKLQETNKINNENLEAKLNENSRTILETTRVKNDKPLANNEKLRAEVKAEVKETIKHLAEMEAKLQESSRATDEKIQEMYIIDQKVSDLENGVNQKLHDLETKVNNLQCQDGPVRFILETSFDTVAIRNMWKDEENTIELILALKGNAASSKGLQIVIKGIDSCVDPEDIKAALEHNKFKIKNVVNIRNHEKIPQPMFRVELEPGDVNLKKNETHPINNLKYLLHRKITIEEPHKRSGHVQCLNCQEYGHTRAHCKLPPVCVVCGELHGSKQCDKSKNYSKVNYRGCPVYSIVKRTLTQKPSIYPVQSKNLIDTHHPQISQTMNNKGSYASVLRTNPTVRAN